MTEVESSVRIVTCSSNGATIGFAGIATSVRMFVETICSCGGRHPVTSGPAVVGLFGSAGRTVQTWADPATGTLGRGALSQTRLFYATTGRAGSPQRAVRFSTDLADLAGRRAPWPAFVAAVLTGEDQPPMPLTPYEGIVQLACGTTLTVSPGRERLNLQELDLTEMTDRARHVLDHRRCDPPELVRLALRHAIDDVVRTGGVGCVIADGGGLGAAALAAAGAGRTRRLHVHVDLPVLDRRRARLPAGTTVIDATAHWRFVCDSPSFGFSRGTDPWPPTPDLLGEAGLAAVPVLSGSGLVPMLTVTPGQSGRLLTGWRQLTSASPYSNLYGEPGWRAWRPPLGEEPAPTDDHDHSHDDAGPGDWISASAEHAGTTVTSARTDSHLIPVDDDPAVTVPGAAAVRAVIEDLERCCPPVAGAPRLEPVLICAHPVVLGTAVLLARRGRLRVRRRDGYIQPVPVLGDLVPDGWQPADVTPQERGNLLAAAFVTRRLATPAQREELLARVAHSPWIVADRLRAVLSDPGRTLAEAQALRRLYVTAEHHPGVPEGRS